MTVQVQRLTGAIGAVLDGFDITDYEPADLDALRHAIAAHRVVFLRRQTTDPAPFVALGKELGTLNPEHPAYFDAHPDHPEIAVVHNDVANGGIAAADEWHSDITWRNPAPLGSALQFVEVPPYGGDTMWMDLVRPYETLSEPMQSFLGTLEAVHRNGDRTARHPVVIELPETGERAIFVNPIFTDHIAGLARKESDALLAFCYAHVNQPENLLRWKWTVGDIVFWDNRSTWHYGLGDHGGAPRRAHRIALEGERFVAP